MTRFFVVNQVLVFDLDDILEDGNNPLTAGNSIINPFKPLVLLREIVPPPLEEEVPEKYGRSALEAINHLFAHIAARLAEGRSSHTGYLSSTFIRPCHIMILSLNGRLVKLRI